MIRFLPAIAALLAIAACGRADQDPSSSAPNASTGQGPAAPDEAIAAVAASTAVAPPASFAQCKTCHAVTPGQHGIGPSLAKVHGRTAGAAAGFRYSSAMAESGLTWDDAALDRFLDSPMQAVPGTRMVFAGQKDPAKRAEIIAYLKTI